MHKWNLNPVNINHKTLKQGLGKDNYIFIGSGTDMFASNVPTEWIESVLEKCCWSDNTYLFQTKNPERFAEFNYPKKTILCTTLESNRHFDEMGESPLIVDRVKWLKFASNAGHKTMITIEPIMDFDVEIFSEMILSCNPFQVNIGADSKKSNLDEPPVWKIEELIELLKGSTKVHYKDNLKRLLTVK
jgi:DNA repair photolyase